MMNVNEPARLLAVHLLETHVAHAAAYAVLGNAERPGIPIPFAGRCRNAPGRTLDENVVSVYPIRRRARARRDRVHPPQLLQRLRHLWPHAPDKAGLPAPSPRPHRPPSILAVGPLLRVNAGLRTEPLGHEAVTSVDGRMSASRLG